MVCSTEIVRRKKSMCLGRNAMSSPQRSPVSMSVMISSWNLSGISEASRSYSGGVRMRVLRGGILGSSMPSHGLVRVTRSRTARLTLLCLESSGEGVELAEDLARDVALEAAADLASCSALGGAA